jgi:hypothetical protein
MSNFEPNLIDLKLIDNDDGSATLDTKNTVYESYDINFVKIIASIFIDRDVTKYCFFMYLKDPKFPNYDYTWAIKLKNTKYTDNTSFIQGNIEQDGKQITCNNF